MILLGAAPAASAQTAPAAAAAPSDDPPATVTDAVEEIIVTAQKRPENIQNVPVQITALTATDIVQRGITSAASLSQFVPALSVSEAGGGTILPFLRGVGNLTGEVGNESSVALYLDDVYVSRLDASFLELADVSRIEVLNGPQGTLFGRNASAGVINIVTKDPAREPEGLVMLGYGNYNTSTEKLYLSGPLTSTIRANLSLVNTNQADGWGRNLAGDKIGFLSPFVVRSKLIVDLTPSTTVRISGDYSRSRGNEGLPSNTVPNTSTGSPDFYALPPYNRTLIKYTNIANYYDNGGYGPDIVRKNGFGASVRIDQDTGFARISSITAYRKEIEHQALGGYVPEPAGEVDLNSKNRTLTEELQVSSQPNSPFDWLVGFFYLSEFAAYDPVALSGANLPVGVLGGAFGPTLPPGSELDLFSQEQVNEYAVFTQETFHLPARTNLTLGFRYTWDQLHAKGHTGIIIPSVLSTDFPGAIDTRSSFREPSFKAGVDHKFGEDILGYASVSRGFKAGTYNLLPLTLPPTQPEVLTDYEIGFKTSFLDRKLQLNGAIFYYDYSHPQVSEVQNNLLFLANAQAARVKGAELTGQFVATSDLKFRFGMNYLDAKYTSFPGAPQYLPNHNPPYGILLSTIDAKGRDLPFAPDFKLNAGTTYTLNTGVGRFVGDVNYTYNNGYAYTPDNVLRQGPYSLLDASIIYTLPNNDHWALRAWARNLTGTRYSYGDLEVQGFVGYEFAPAPPREYGFSVTYRFGK